MNIVLQGQYQLVPGTLTPQTSKDTVYEAAIAISLYQGAWLWAPQAGSTLDRFKRLRQTAARVDEFQKELVAYLEPYGDQVVNRLTGRNGVQYDLSIPNEVLT